MKKSFGLFIVLATIWWLWSGHNTVLIVSFGIGSCLLVCLLANRMGLVDTEGLQVHRLPGLIHYWTWLTVEIIKSNIDVSRRIITGNIRPATKKIPTNQRSDLGRVIYANSITLTPGTLSYELDSEHIHVHALHGNSLDDLDNGKMARRINKLEDKD